MTTDIWAARTERFERVKAKLLRPDWARRVSGVSARLTKPDCFKCGGEDFMHSVTCAQTYLNTRVAFGNAVIKAAAKHEQKLQLDATFAQMKALAVESGLWAAIQAQRVAS